MSNSKVEKKLAFLKIPISVKLIVMFVGFLVTATLIFAQQSSELFTRVLVQREEFSNLTEAASRASELDQIVNSLIERSQNVAQAQLKIYQEKLVAGDKIELQSFELEREKYLINMEIIDLKGGKVQKIIKGRKTLYSAKYNLTDAFFESIRQARPVDVGEVLGGKIRVDNTSSPKGPALGTTAIPIAKDDEGRITHIAIIDFSLENILKLYSADSERSQFLTDDKGNVLGHLSEDKILSHANMAQNPLIQKAMKDSTPRRQTQFFDPESNEEYIGAYVKLNHLGLITFSQISKSLILEPAVNVKRRAYYIAGIVVSVAIFLIFLFSMTLTGPIEKLVDHVTLVAKGKFDIKASNEVKALLEDEVHDLAHAIDHMTEGLMERDKVKTLFGKFHGSSVAEDLMKNDIAIGGSTKEVTVFFSDIRGFTSFSEKRTPEEVVQMLNEYFEVMVAIINRSGGVVDKFIGDAIMAVWGAPKATEKDTEKALQACLDMRSGLNELNEKRIARGHEPLLIGMGLHHGPAISGTIGSTERMEYTVIGDTINMTSRIESSTKSFGTDLLVSQAVIDKTQGSFVTELAGKATVKGKAEPLNLYKVLGYRDVQGNPVIIETPYSAYEKEKDEKVKTAS